MKYLRTIDNIGVVSNDVTGTGSTGPVTTYSTVERTFPPPIGLTFAAWIFIERLPGQSSNIMRLFCIQRRWITGQPHKRCAVMLFSIFLDFQTNEIVVRIRLCNLPTLMHKLSCSFNDSLFTYVHYQEMAFIGIFYFPLYL